MSLHRWYENHLGIAACLYTMLVSAVLFFLIMLFFYDGRYSVDFRTIVFYFYFWLAFYGFGNIMARMATKDIDKMVEDEKNKAIARQDRALIRAIRRSKEDTVRREKLA